MADSRLRTVAQTADPAPAPDAPARREPMLPEIGLEDSPQPAPAGPPNAEQAGSGPPAQGESDPLAPLKSLSEAELIALFS